MDKARIVEAVLADTVGAIVLRKSTAYYLINDLAKMGYIAVNESCKLTDKGYALIHQELKRIELERLILKQRLHM